MNGSGAKETPSRANTVEEQRLGKHVYPGMKRVHGRTTRKSILGTPFPAAAEQKRIINATHIIRDSQQRILHASDMLTARKELGPLNLNYAEADRKMLEQAKRLQKKLG